MRSEIVRPIDKTIHLSDEINEDFEEEYYKDHRERRKRMRRLEEPWTQLSTELEEVPWPHRFNAAIMPQYEGESDPREFLLRYEAAVESNGGGSGVKAKPFVMALKAPAQQWYASLPKGEIHSWN